MSPATSHPFLSVLLSVSWLQASSAASFDSLGQAASHYTTSRCGATSCLDLDPCFLAWLKRPVVKAHGGQRTSSWGEGVMCGHCTVELSHR
ncbi:hypothetical protein UPYG_G00225970 [Umbra pygmaea]|uniref:Secreted protein n=1 Tax=Umbra pygmaea TaxID=75934 RepID=A0ABD0WWW2_UMBPY